jgi:hypothetical protein
VLAPTVGCTNLKSVVSRDNWSRGRISRIIFLANIRYWRITPLEVSNFYFGFFIYFHLFLVVLAVQIPMLEGLARVVPSDISEKTPES